MTRGRVDPNAKAGVDYFAYDLRSEPYRVDYVGPIGSVLEAIADCEEEGFVFASFDDWYTYVTARDA